MKRASLAAVTALMALLGSAGGCGHDTGSGTGASRGASVRDRAPGPAPTPVSGTLTGLYVEPTDRPLFTECGTDRRWGIADGGAARELANAYRAVRSEPGQATRVTVEAHSARASSGDGSDDLVIDKVVMVSGETVCPGQQADASLTGTTWRVVSLKGHEVTPTQGTATLRLDGETRQLSGFTACRAITGMFRWTGTALTFGGIDVGGQTCASQGAGPALGVDAAMLEVLRTTGSYRIRGDTLELMGESGVQARLAAEG
jgi:heat shock protein HslJ